MKFFISEHKMFKDEKSVNIGRNIESFSFVVVPSMDPIIYVNINHTIVANVILEELIFL